MKRLTYYAPSQTANGQEIVNWRENDINDSLFYSCRSTVYDRARYPSRLHYHDYYELVVFVEGEIEYVCEAEVLHPRRGDVILIPPRTLHMSRMQGEQTLYRRHVFYLYKDAFVPFGCDALAEILSRTDRSALLTLARRETVTELLSLLERLDRALAEDQTPMERALAVGYLLQIFYLLNGAAPVSDAKAHRLPPNVLKIQAYLDQHFAEIQSVAEVAQQLYYSREYLSRIFKKYYNTTVADYIRQRRVAYSQELIAAGVPITKACYQAGFGNMSAFIRAFRHITGMTPSAYQQSVRA